MHQRDRTMGRVEIGLRGRGKYRHKDKLVL